MKYCPSCGKAGVQGMKFCPRCGQRLVGFNLEEKQRYAQKPEAPLKERTCFERHLNLTMLLGMLGAFLAVFVAVVVVFLSDLYVSDDALSVISLITALAILIPVWRWALRRKNRSLWWLSLGLFVPFGFIVLLFLENKSLTNDANGNSIADYSNAIKLNPNHADAYYERGDFYYEMDEYGKAVADYSKTIELNPSHAEAYYSRGCAYDEIGEYDKAIADYNKTIELDPNHALAYYNRGLAYQEKGEGPKAVSDLEKCIGLSIDPELTETAQQALYEIKKSP